MQRGKQMGLTWTFQLPSREAGGPVDRAGRRFAEKGHFWSGWTRGPVTNRPWTRLGSRVRATLGPLHVGCARAREVGGWETPTGGGGVTPSRSSWGAAGGCGRGCDTPENTERERQQLGPCSCRGYLPEPPGGRCTVFSRLPSPSRPPTCPQTHCRSPGTSSSFPCWTAGCAPARGLCMAAP